MALMVSPVRFASRPTVICPDGLFSSMAPSINTPLDPHPGGGHRLATVTPEEDLPMTQCATDNNTARALCGWSPPALPADTALKRAVDRFVPFTGGPVIVFYLTVTAILLVAGFLPVR